LIIVDKYNHYNIKHLNSLILFNIFDYLINLSQYLLLYTEAFGYLQIKLIKENTYVNYSCCVTVQVKQKHKDFFRKMKIQIIYLQVM